MIIGKYTLTKELSKKVFEVVDDSGNVYVARLEDHSDKTTLFHCDFLPKITDSFFWEEQNQTVTVVNHIAGETLEQKVFSEPGLSRILGWLSQILMMLRQLHDQNWLLGDISPTNFVCDESGKVFFVDYEGLFYADLDYSEDLTFPQYTPGYAPPEMTGGKIIPASDVFAVGRLAVFFLTGRSPVHFYKETGFEWRQHVNISQQVVNFVELCMAPNPIDRPRVGDAIQYLHELPLNLRREDQWKRYKWPVTILLALIAINVFWPLQRQFRSWNLRIRGDQQQLLGEREYANELYRRSAKLNSENVYANVGLGQTCREERCGVEHLEAALRIDPGNDLVRYNLAVLFEDIDLQKAQDLYESIDQASPRYLLAQNNLARVRILQEDYEGALKILDSLINMGGDKINKKLLSKIFKNKGWIYLRQGDAIEAEKNLSQSVTLYPLLGDPYCLRAFIEPTDVDLLSCFELELISPEAKKIKTQLFYKTIFEENE